VKKDTASRENTISGEPSPARATLTSLRMAFAMEWKYRENGERLHFGNHRLAYPAGLPGHFHSETHSPGLEHWGYGQSLHCQGEIDVTPLQMGVLISAIVNAQSLCRDSFSAWKARI